MIVINKVIAELAGVLQDLNKIEKLMNHLLHLKHLNYGSIFLFTEIWFEPMNHLV